MSTSNKYFIAFIMILLMFSTAYFCLACEKLQEQIEIKDTQIIELQTKNADYSRIHKWIPLLEQLLTPLARLELDALAEKLIQEKAEDNYGILQSS